MKPIQFTIEGQPHGKERARSRIVKARSGKQFTSHYTPTKTRQAENGIALIGKAAMQGAKPTALPVALSLNMFFQIPPSWPKWKKQAALKGDILPTGKPDIDNVLKSIKDGLNGIAWHDDSQVVAVSMSKHYCAEPKTIVVIEPVIALPITATRLEAENFDNGE